VSFRVQRGQIVAVVGANGAGKTSTLRAIAKFVESTGTVTMSGRNLTKAAAHQCARAGLLLVPDDRGLFPALTVRDHLWLASPERRRPAKAELGQVTELFPVLFDRQRQRAGSLSGGEQQMLAMAMALLTRPSFLLVDEMSTGLAPIIVERLFEAVQQIVQETNVGVVLVDQFVNQVLEVADYAMVMARGSVALEGPAADLRSRPDEVSAAYFGTKDIEGNGKGSDVID
jgi:branched-chain amino acid transport system ATP-binding protein